VIFTPSAPGPRTADLRIHFAHRSQPRDLILTGNGLRQAHGISVTGLFPARGPATGGTTVTITGSGFTGASSVSFGGTSVVPTVDSDTQISVSSPQGTGVVNVTVVAPGGTSAVTPASQFTYTAPPAAPTVTGIDPAKGPDTGGTSVTISGTGFTGATGVSFGGTSATTFTVVSDTQITATSPASATDGPADVTVTTPAGTSAPVQFSYFLLIP